MLKKADGTVSKTMIYSFAVTALGIVQTNLGVFDGVIPEWVNGLITIGIGIGIAFFRMLTNEPLQKRGP